LFREERYHMFKGYFRGLSDESAEFGNNKQLTLHPVEIDKNAYANQKLLLQIDLTEFGVEIQHLRRQNMQMNILPRPDILLTEGDVVVLLGPQQGLIAAEMYLISGKAR